MVVTPAEPETFVNEPVTLTAHAEARPGASITGYAWTVDGIAAGTGSTLTRSFGTAGLHVVTLTVTQSDGTTVVRTVRVNVPNRPPPAPVLNMEGSEISPDGSISFSPVTDPEGDPVSYEVEVFGVPGHVLISSDYFTLDEENHRIVFHGLPTGDYEVRVRAVGGDDPGPWSDPVSVSVVPGAPTLVSPAEGASLWYEDCFDFQWDTDEESSQLQIAATADFSDPAYSEWFEGASLEICPTDLPEGGSLEAGTYYWRVRVAPLTGTPSPWSEVRSFQVTDNRDPTVPELTQAPSAAYYTRDTISFAFEATDPDGDPLTYTLNLSQPEMTLTSTTGLFVIEPGELPPGEVVFASIEVSDGRGGVTGLSFAPWGFTVVNSPPEAPAPLSPEDGSVIEGGSVTLQVEASSDFDGDPIGGYEFHLLRHGSGAWQVYSSPGPSITLTGLVRDTYLWKARALASAGTEQGDFSPEREFSLQANRPPTAVAVSPTPGTVVQAGAPGSLEASATDPDGDPVAWYQFQLAADADFGEVLWEEKVVGPVLELKPLEPGNYYWRVRASDGLPDGLGPWSETLCFTAVREVPAPTVDTAATPDTFGPPKEGLVELKIVVEPGIYDCLGRTAGVLVYQVASDEAFSSVLASGLYRRSLVVPLEPGIYYFRVIHRAGEGLVSPWSEPFRFGVEGPPTAAADAYSTPEDTVLEVEAPGVLANDVDPNGDSLTAERVSGPAHGTLELGPDGGFSYVPDRDFFGTDSFTYRARDASSASAPVQVTLTVEPVDDPPVGAPDAYSTPEDTVLEVEAPGVLANDADPDGDALGFEVEAPSFCSLEDHGDGTAVLTCSPASGDAGTYTVNVTVEDDGDPPLSDEGSFVLTVTSTPENPVGNGDFEADGLDPWVAYEPAITGNLTIEIVSEDGSRRLHYARSDSAGNGGEMYAHQVLGDGVDLSAYSEVYLECDVKLVRDTLQSSGGWSYYQGGHGEWPAEIRFVNQGAETWEWHHGFADFDDYYERTNYTKVELGTWYHYRSPNLKEVQTTETEAGNVPIESGPPTRITEVKVGGSGWDFEGYFDNVRLILVE